MSRGRSIFFIVQLCCFAISLACFSIRFAILSSANFFIFTSPIAPFGESGVDPR